MCSHGSDGWKSKPRSQQVHTPSEVSKETFLASGVCCQSLAFVGFITAPQSLPFLSHAVFCVCVCLLRIPAIGFRAHSCLVWKVPCPIRMSRQILKLLLLLWLQTEPWLMFKGLAAVQLADDHALHTSLTFHSRVHCYTVLSLDTLIQKNICAEFTQWFIYF